MRYFFLRTHPKIWYFGGRPPSGAAGEFIAFPQILRWIKGRSEEGNGRKWKERGRREVKG